MKIAAGIVIFFIVLNQAFAQPSAAFFYSKHVPVPEICLYDNIVVDPNSDFNPTSSCGSSNNSFAYVSLGEVPKNAVYINNIKKDWIIGNNKSWNNNFIIDQTSHEWQNFFINEIITPLWQKGYRGFFFDTLDSYTLAVHDPALQIKQINSIVSLIQQVRSKYPDAKIILNRGFTLLPQLQNDVYAVVIESLYHAWNQQSNRYEETPLAIQKELLAQITRIKQMHLPIMIIDYLPPDQQHKAVLLEKEISQQGMIPWITNNELNTIYNNKIHNVLREILIVFNSENNFPVRYVPSFRFLAGLLEYLGYVPKYIDLHETKLLPTDDLSKKYAGIIFWFDSSNAKNIYLLDWAQKQIANHIPIVFLNSFGVPTESAALGKFGLHTSSIVSSDKPSKIVKMDSKYLNFEMFPSTNPYDFYPFRADSSQVLLQLKNEYQQTQDVVAITPWGGYALVPQVLYYRPDYYPLWVINPLNFLQDALRLHDFPVPVATTENGRRFMTVHIDGDGFSYPANWIGGTFAGNELLEKVLKKYRIPTSVSVITGEIAPNGLYPKKSKEFTQTARNIFALPWVEIASHTFSHPFFWQESTHKNFASLFIGEPFSIHIPGYKFNLNSEITGSVDYINQYLAPANKKCRLMFWSGMADTSAQILKIAYDGNLLNINGQNDTYIDDQHPSLTGIRPMAFELGGYYQIFAPIDMDFYYMNGFSGPLYGFENVIQTLQLTDKPRRFKPIDLYYHVYSASFPASLKALYKVYDWALTQPVMNIFISDYIKKVMDYYKVTIAQNDASWLIYSGGELRELRSGKKAGYPDLLKSHNVIGFKENKDDLYIHLGPNRFTLLNYQNEKPAVAYLVEANAGIVDFSRNKNELKITFQGYMPLQFTLANVSACKVSAKDPFTKITHEENNMTSYQSGKATNEIYISC